MNDKSWFNLISHGNDNGDNDGDGNDCEDGDSDDGNGQY